MAELIRVLVVDDHPVVLSGIAAALMREDDIELAGRAGSVSEALTIMSETPIDVALVDFRLPDGTGIDVLRGAEELEDAPPILMLSTFDTPQYIDAAIRLGAAGFLTKTSSLDVILDAVRRVAAGRTTFTVEQLRGARQHPWAPLTEREAQIVAGVINGRSNDELSGDLHLSKKTIEAYLTRLFERHGVASRVELAVKAEREGWLDLPRPDRGRAP